MADDEAEPIRAAERRADQYGLRQLEDIFHGMGDTVGGLAGQFDRLDGDLLTDRILAVVRQLDLTQNNIAHLRHKLNNMALHALDSENTRR